MYLRTTKRKNKDGSIVEYFQLAHNVWNQQSSQAVAKIIHNFSRADELDRGSLIRLCKSIARVCGAEVNEITVPQEKSLAGRDQDLLPDEVKLIQTRELGTAMVLEVLWERLGIASALKNIIKQKGYNEAYERALLAMTANRLCEPESKLGFWNRWLSKVHLPSCQDLKLDQMYEAMDFLQAHSATVEEAVFFRTAHLFNLDVDLIFYDTTTAAFPLEEAERHCQLPWERIKDDLSSLQATEFQTPQFQFFQRHEPSRNLLSTLKSLDIPMPRVVLNINPITTET
ncbi:hypothetical protein Desac_1012 [Desulfobacca acetoxidans DSM 11109]|uniref:Uncharacterized protein n=1 Tax=Desulfobacca acetoxidans (strain ATCC 700848 / DSM 11109 / ASRB2) TaxID=880072 RepID=F2NC84_DESAR|nr:hypothetical protein Desac_1012 [Desulfobacca acetoxidans DSM 11109]